MRHLRELFDQPSRRRDASANINRKLAVHSSTQLLRSRRFPALSRVSRPSSLGWSRQSPSTIAKLAMNAVILGELAARTRGERGEAHSPERSICERGGRE